MLLPQPIRLNKDWVVSNNRHVFLIKLDGETCAYCKSEATAEALIRSLGAGIEEELKADKGRGYTITKEIIEGATNLPGKVIIYEQPLGYLYNSYPKIKHTITYSSVYKCYFYQKPQTTVESSTVNQEIALLDPEKYYTIQEIIAIAEKKHEQTSKMSTETVVPVTTVSDPCLIGAGLVGFSGLSGLMVFLVLLVLLVLLRKTPLMLNYNSNSKNNKIKINRNSNNKPTELKNR